MHFGVQITLATNTGSLFTITKTSKSKTNFRVTSFFVNVTVSVA